MLNDIELVAKDRNGAGPDIDLGLPRFGRSVRHLLDLREPAVLGCGTGRVHDLSESDLVAPEWTLDGLVGFLVFILVVEKGAHISILIYLQN